MPGPPELKSSSARVATAMLASVTPLTNPSWPRNGPSSSWSRPPCRSLASANSRVRPDTCRRQIALEPCLSNTGFLALLATIQKILFVFG